MKQTLDKSEGIDQRAARRARESPAHAEKQDFAKCSNLQSNLTSIQTKFGNERFNEACSGEN